MKYAEALILMKDFSLDFNGFLDSTVFDREQRSKVLKEALLLFLFLVLAWNQKQKMFLM